MNLDVCSSPFLTVQLGSKTLKTVQRAEIWRMKLIFYGWRPIPGDSCKLSFRRSFYSYHAASVLIFCRARKTEAPLVPTAKDLLLENPYTPTSTLAQAIIRASPLLTELFVVREWLHDTAPPPSPPEANTGYWKFTKHTLMQNIRTGHALRDGLILEMDPDVINRGVGVTLAADDAVRSCFCPFS